MIRKPSNPSARAGRRVLVNVVAPFIGVTLALSGCSWVPDWANPMTAYDSIFSDDPAPPVPASAEEKQLATQQSGGTFPNVGSVPDKAPKTASAAERQQVLQGLVADRQNAKYTDSTTAAAGQQVASAPPPPPIIAPSVTTSVPVTGSSTAVAAATTTQPVPALPRALSVPSIVQGGPQPIAPPQAGAPYPQTLLPSTGPRPSSVVSVPPTPQPAVPTTIPQVAQPTLPVNVPPLQSTLQQVAAVPPVSASLSAPAPALPGQYTTVAQVFAARLAQSGATVTNAPAHLGFQLAAQPVNSLPLLAQSGAGGTNMVRPAVATNPTLSAVRSVGFAGASQPVVVRFPHGSAQIASSERAKVSDIAKRYRASGGGFIRVVGHASSRTKNLPVDKHKLVNFWISMDRAQAVARALMRAGVAPNAIVVEARSDGEPMFFESMPAGEAQNRRAEVYLEF